MKKQIMIDLDVVTVAYWDRSKNGDTARSFRTRIENKEFQLVTPFLLIELVIKWKYESLKNSIKDFYVKNSDLLLTDTDIREKCDLMQVNYEKVIRELERKGIKEEDAALVLVASLFSCDCLVTFNRIHLRNKKEAANKILSEHKLRTIQILGPEEV